MEIQRQRVPWHQANAVGATEGPGQVRSLSLPNHPISLVVEVYARCFSPKDHRCFQVAVSALVLKAIAPNIAPLAEVTNAAIL